MDTFKIIGILTTVLRDYTLINDLCELWTELIDCMKSEEGKKYLEEHIVLKNIMTKIQYKLQ